MGRKQTRRDRRGRGGGAPASAAAVGAPATAAHSRPASPEHPRPSAPPSSQGGRCRHEDPAQPPSALIYAKPRRAHSGACWGAGTPSPSCSPDLRTGPAAPRRGSGTHRPGAGAPSTLFDPSALAHPIPPGEPGARDQASLPPRRPGGAGEPQHREEAAVGVGGRATRFRGW